MADCFIIRKGEVSNNEAIPDIYNHGDIVGLNGDAFHIDRNLFNIYQCFFTKTQNTQKNMSFSDTSLITYDNGNQVWYIPIKIRTKGYKYLCVDAEITNATQGAYNMSTFGAMKSFNDPEYLRPYFHTRYDFTNYNESRYNFERQIVKINIEELDDIIIGAHCCNCQLNIYSIYLSND